MTANYRKPGTKEYKKISLLKEAMIGDDMEARRKAMFIYNSIMSTEYDSTIKNLEEEINKREKVLNISNKKALKNDKDNNFSTPGDKLGSHELESIRFQLKYYNQLKDIEVDSKLKKTKIKL